MAANDQNEDMPPEALAFFEKHDRTKAAQEHLKFSFRKSQMACNEQPDPEAGTAFTYRKLKEYLSSLNEDQLNQEVMAFHSLGVINEAVQLEPVYAVGTVEEMFHVAGYPVYLTRSSKDDAHHPEQVILVRDSPPFGKHGDSYYALVRDEETGLLMHVGNKTGRKTWIGGIPVAASQPRPGIKRMEYRISDRLTLRRDSFDSLGVVDCCELVTTENGETRAHHVTPWVFDLFLDHCRNVED